MSRSRKHTTGFTDPGGRVSPKRFFKNYANRLARKERDLTDGSSYKKRRFMQYRICDNKFLFYNKKQLDAFIEYWGRRSGIHKLYKYWSK